MLFCIACSSEQKSQNNKSQKCYISPIWGKPPLDRFDPKVAWWVTSRTLSRVPSFKLKSSWVTILHGVEFSIFLLIFAWALQQFSANALSVLHNVYIDVTVLPQRASFLHSRLKAVVRRSQAGVNWQLLLRISDDKTLDLWPLNQWSKMGFGRHKPIVLHYKLQRWNLLRDQSY